MNSKQRTEIIKRLQELGAYKVGEIETINIRFDPSLRKLCEMNVCGKFNTNWMCPPQVGDVGELIAKAKTYTKGIVFQTVGQLEDSFDIEGMGEAGEVYSQLLLAIQKVLKKEWEGEYLLLGAGGCKRCERCGLKDKQPCYFPEEAIPSLEAYGIQVSELAAEAGVRYINGQNTVTYFGAILY